MLRKRFVSSDNHQSSKTKKRKGTDVKAPLGSSKVKKDTEKELESLVLGGEDQIIDVLTSFTEKVN